MLEQKSEPGAFDPVGVVPPLSHGWLVEEIEELPPTQKLSKAARTTFLWRVRNRFPISYTRSAA
jgi:hypothetical protein